MHREGKKSSRCLRLHPGRFRQPRDASRSVSEISDIERVVEVGNDVRYILDADRHLAQKATTDQHKVM